MIGPGVAPVRVVEEKRPREYPVRLKANPGRKNPPDLRDGQVGPADDPGGRGWEVVREATVCAGCA